MNKIKCYDCFDLLEEIEEQVKYIRDLALGSFNDWMKNSDKIITLTRDIEKEIIDLVERTYDEIPSETKW